MALDPKAVLIPRWRSNVPASLGATSPNTRRTMVSFCPGGGNQATTWQDIVYRAGFTLPMFPTRVRFRIRNANSLTSTFNSTPINISGIWMGPAATSGLTAWAGAFASTPTQILTATGFVAMGSGGEYVSPWTSVPSSFAVNQMQAISVGIQCATDSQIYYDTTPGISWHASSSGTYPVSALAGNTAAPGSGTVSYNAAPLDIRMEYEFVGPNAIGTVLGTSLTNGFLVGNGFGVVSAPLGHMGPDNTWPTMVGNRVSQGVTNGGVTGASVNNFTASSWPWLRLLDNDGVHWPGQCTPDYVVLDLGINDCSTATSLSTIQTRFTSLISLVQSSGVSKIVACTVPPGPMINGVLGGLTTPTYQIGTLQTAISAGAATSMVLFGPAGTGATSNLVNTNVAQAGPGGGFPGNIGSWYQSSGGPWQITIDYPASGVSEGPITLTGASAGTAANGYPLTLSFSSFTFANSHLIGAPVFATCEGIRQNVNNWLRQLPPGIVATVETAATVEQPSQAATVVVSSTKGYPSASFGPAIQRADVYYWSGNVHPSNLAFASFFAREVSSSIGGL